jgi:hypothetical protein
MSEDAFAERAALAERVGEGGVWFEVYADILSYLLVKGDMPDVPEGTGREAVSQAARSWIDAALAEARRAALEEAAKIADAHRRDTSLLLSNPPQSSAARDIALAIRALAGEAPK